MIQALKELGEQKLKNEGREVTDLLDTLIQDPNEKGNYPQALVVQFDKTDGHLNYLRVETEPASKSKVRKYLYRFKAPQGADFTPTSKITDDIEKSFRNKTERWFKETEEKSSIISLFKKSFESSKKLILDDLRNKLHEVRPSLKRKEGCFITFGVLENGIQKYLGDFPDFQAILIEGVKTRYQKIKKDNHICSVCGLTKGEVYGEAIPLAFYTLDKPGYVAGGFNEQNAWKNAPVCLECSLKIEEGKRFLDERLQFRMGGLRYYLLPKFLFGGEEVQDVVSHFFRVAKEREALRQKELKYLSEDEEEILKEISDLKDILTFNFLFYATPTKSVFRINLLVEDILPSRIGHLFRAKASAEDHDSFKAIKIGNEYEDIEFRFSNLTRRAPGYVFSLIPSQRDFLEVVDKSFRGVPLNRNLLYSWFMTTIRGVFVNEGYLTPWVLNAFVSLLFFKELGILAHKNQTKKGGGVMMADLGAQAEKFFGTYEETFDVPAVKALFLLGGLAQKILNIQYQERKSTPFRKNLKSLRMTERDFCGLLPKIQNKLEEYNKNYYRKLEELISDYLIQSGQGWEMSTDEMNFYFVLGMNLENKVSEALGLGNREEKESDE